MINAFSSKVPSWHFGVALWVDWPSRQRNPEKTEVSESQRIFSESQRIFSESVRIFSEKSVFFSVF